MTRPVLGESRLGMIFTNGDPTGQSSNTVAGADFQYALQLGGRSSRVYGYYGNWLVNDQWSTGLRWIYTWPTQITQSNLGNHDETGKIGTENKFRLGDVMVGTLPRLAMRFVADSAESRSVTRWASPFSGPRIV